VRKLKFRNIYSPSPYLTKKSNQPEDDSQLELKHVVERNNIRNTPQ